ncbi:MAG: hypothetical protein DA446_03415 [Bacteroidetes bacterium]|jgi:hypothetical protein|nr:MAG: hypothetical protein DA443_02940 [Bacteroidota bacterium]PTM20397.1 MAG: hypothetical protein DA446_03415 [Bacteroidota bacterium]
MLSMKNQFHPRTRVKQLLIPGFLPVLFLFMSVGFLSCDDGPTAFTLTEPNFDNVAEPFDISGLQPVVIEEGLEYIQVDPGNTDSPFEVVIRDQIRIHLTLRNQEGTIIYSTWQNGNDTPVVFNVSNIQLSFPTIYGPSQAYTEGLQRGVLGMRVDEKRVLLVAPELGFSGLRQGSLNEAFRNDTLRYDIELFEIL